MNYLKMVNIQYFYDNGDRTLIAMEDDEKSVSVGGKSSEINI